MALKKYFLILNSIFVLQTLAKAQVAVGVMAGPNMPCYTVKMATTQDTKKIGPKAGLMIDIARSEIFSVQTGAYYVRNGYKTTKPYYYDLNINTIEIPLNIAVKLGYPDENRFFLSIGPYFSAHLEGNLKYVLADPYNTWVRDTSTISLEKTPVRPFEIGFGVNAGYEMKNGLIARIYYQRSFQNLYEFGRNGFSVVNARNYSFGISIGYMFKRKKEPNKDK